MTIAAALAWIEFGQKLVTVGAATVAEIRQFIGSQNGTLTPADLDAICDHIAAGAAKHAALATADAGGS